MNGHLHALYCWFSDDDRILIAMSLAHPIAFARMRNLVVLSATLFVLPKFDSMEPTSTLQEHFTKVLGVVRAAARLLLPEIACAPENFCSLKRVLTPAKRFPLSARPRFWPSLRPGSASTRFLTTTGYLNRSEENVESRRSGWFVTGNMGCLVADGYLHIDDREKDMVLSNGHNIYSGEVENVHCRASECGECGGRGRGGRSFRRRRRRVRHALCRRNGDRERVGELVQRADRKLQETEGHGIRGRTAREPCRQGTQEDPGKFFSKV